MTNTAANDSISSHRGFARLCENLSVFNPFDVLGLETYELRHTKTLAWLLDPKGSHKLGTAFLERFLQGLPGAVRGTLPANAGAALVFSELVVKEGVLMIGEASAPETAEQVSKSRIDVYLQIGSDFFLAIEAKLGAKEHGNQLRDYREAVENQAAGLASHTTTLLYLTLDGAQPVRADEAKSWTAISWSEHVLVPLRATLREALRLAEGIETPADNVLHFLSDYRRTLEKVTKSREYAPRLLAEQILMEEAPKGPIHAMIDTFHGQEKAPKVRLQLQLKAMKGGAEAAKLLMEVESDMRAAVCDTITSQVLRADCVQIRSANQKKQRKSANKTSIDFITAKMASVMGTTKPAFCFRLDIRRTEAIELKLFFQEPRLRSSEEPLPWPQEQLMQWRSRKDCGVEFDNWNLGDNINGGIGQKMAVITIDRKPEAIVRRPPEAGRIKQVQAWLANVISFVDLRMDELHKAAGDA
ncbi:PD-(D/E)XK nuclease family protein [Massilia sp. LXY-6]|uniref:PDDEXK-like family protein n=1 Tax=Massilia sp. LXY-6 TaxID=3379823 RepID=UPI003EDF525D